MKIPYENTQQQTLKILGNARPDGSLISKKIIPQKFYIQKRHLALLKSEIELLKNQGEDIRNMSQILREILDQRFRL